MNDALLAEYERSIIDLKRRPPKSEIGMRQALSHVKNVKRKLRSLRLGKEAYLIERRLKWHTNR